jgi:hypothetical protein
MTDQSSRTRSRGKSPSPEPVAGGADHDHESSALDGTGAEDHTGRRDEPARMLDAREMHQMLWDSDPDSGGVAPDDWIYSDFYEPGYGAAGPTLNWSVARWMDWYPIVAVGRRPGDHMARDLMHGSLLRNHRVPMFARLASEPEEWLRDAVAHLPARQRPQAVQHLALRLMHGRGLFHFSEGFPKGHPTDTAYSSIRDLQSCRPFGVLVRRVDHEDWEWRYPDFTCKRSRECPWCLARWAMDFYGRLRRGPCRPRSSAGKHLLLARIEVPSDLLPGPRVEEVYLAHAEGDRWMEDGLGINSRRRLGRREVECARRDWGDRLRGWALACGAVGGVLVHQVGPHLSEYGVRFIHDLTILAEVPTATPEQRRRLVDVSGVGTDLQPCFGVPGREQRVVTVQAAAIPADRPTALRYLWAGTSVGFRLAAAGIAINGAVDGRWGLDGAVRLLPIFLFDAEQRISYALAMRDRHLAAPFGSWRGAIGPTPPKLPPMRTVSNNRAIVRRLRRLRPLGEHNEQVAQAAQSGRERALEFARPVYAELVRGSGRRPGRDRLRRAMAAAGFEVSERVAKDLVSMLRAVPEPGVP